MKKQQINTIGLSKIKATLTNSDVSAARQSLAFAIGASVDVSGVVLKRVKRNEQCKLVIAPDNVRLTVFADCKGDEQTVITRKIRKRSNVALTGKLLSFGIQSVCLSDCHLVTS
jgi:primosomal replication protein N